MSRTSVRGQILADLVAKFVEPPLEEVAATRNMDEKSVGTISLQEPLFLKVCVDGVANQRVFGVGLVLVSPYQITIEKSLSLGFSATIMRLNMKLCWKECPWFKEWGERQ